MCIVNLIYFLKDKSRTSQEIQEKFNLSQSYVSIQLKQLYNSDIITYDKKGKVKHFKIKHMGIFKLLKIIHSYILYLHKQRIERLSDVSDFDIAEDFF